MGGKVVRIRNPKIAYRNEMHSACSSYDNVDKRSGRLGQSLLLVKMTADPD